MNYSKKDLEHIAKQLYFHQNNLMCSGPANGFVLLKDFLAFIDATPVLAEFIQDNLTEDNSIGRDVISKAGESIVSWRNRMNRELFDFEDLDKKGLIDRLYKLLKHIADGAIGKNLFPPLRGLNVNDGSITKNQIIKPFFNYLNAHLNDLMQNTAEPMRQPAISQSVTIMGNNNGEINAAQYNNSGLDSKALLKLLSQIEASAAKENLLGDELKKLTELLETFKREAEKPEPDKPALTRLASKLLDFLSKPVSFAADIITIVQAFL